MWYTQHTFCKSALLLSFCKNRFCLSQFVKKLNLTERGAIFRLFCVSKVITTAHAHKSGLVFQFFQELSNKKIKALRPKMKNSLKDPLEAILVIFGRSFINYFFCLKGLGKYEKGHHFCAHAQW